MFDLENRTLTQGGKSCAIKRWEVWFMTPKGLATTITEAINECVGNDWLPNQVIIPVPVAIDEAGRYEVIMRQA